MPNYTPYPQPLYPHPPPRLPPQATSHMMAYERAMRHELQLQDQYVRHLELENMRLRVRLEQAEKDVQMATNMVMVACRSGGSFAQAEQPLKTATPTGRSLASGRVSPSNPVVVDDGLGYAPEGEFEEHRSWGVFGGAFAGTAGDGLSAQAAEVKDEQAGGCGRKSSGGSNKWAGLNEATSVDENDWANEKASVLWQADEQLLDLNDATYTIPVPKVATVETQKWSTPPPLRPLTPFAPPTKYKLADPFVTPVKKSKPAVVVDDNVAKSDKSRFHHIFLHDSDETAEITDFSEGKVIAAQFLQKKKEIRAESEIPDFVSRIPDVKLCDRMMVPALSTTAHKREISTETGYPSTEEKKTSDDDNSATVGAHREAYGALQSFSSSDGPDFADFPQGRNGYYPRRGGCGDGYNMGAFRYNVNKPPPRTEEDVRYTPDEGSKNIYRTVMIYNLPPQVDVADIVSRARDAPFLSFKLLPTMGMKNKRDNGSVIKHETATAMITFFLDTSAEQFVFDASVEPLVIRGRTAIVKLLQTPTYPSIHDQTAYATAPGRLITRRLKFHQPGLVPAELFEETLARNSYGFRQPGWIVNRAIKKEAGKNMVTIELASVDLAQFAYNQIGWLREFQGCEPRWVYDHESEPLSGRRGLPKTLDDKDDSEVEVFSGFGTEDDAEVKLVANAALQSASS